MKRSVVAALVLLLCSVPAWADEEPMKRVFPYETHRHTLENGLAVILVRNVVERRGELATLRAFGFRQSRLGWIVVAENAFLLVIGTVVGSAAALIAVAPRLAAVHVPWAPLIATLATVLVFGMLSSVVAVAGALRTPLLPALKADR